MIGIRIPKVPKIPQIPQIHQISQIPQIPQIPSASALRSQITESSERGDKFAPQARLIWSFPTNSTCMDRMPSQMKIQTPELTRLPPENAFPRRILHLFTKPRFGAVSAANSTGQTHPRPQSDPEAHPSAKRHSNRDRIPDKIGLRTPRNGQIRPNRPNQGSRIMGSRNSRAFLGAVHARYTPPGGL